MKTNNEKKPKKQKQCCLDSKSWETKMIQQWFYRAFFRRCTYDARCNIIWELKPIHLFWTPWLGIIRFFLVTDLLLKYRLPWIVCVQSRLNVTVVGSCGTETSTCLFFTVPSRTVRRCNQQKETMKQEFVFCNLILSLCLRDLCFFLLTFQFFLKPKSAALDQTFCFCLCARATTSRKTHELQTHRNTHLPTSKSTPTRLLQLKLFNI